MYVSMYVCM
jgi:hypothetical protein